MKNSIGEVKEFYDKVNENETRVITIKEQVEKRVKNKVDFRAHLYKGS